MSYIEREATLAELEEELAADSPMYTDEQQKYFTMGLRCAYRDVKRQPPADMVAVVRCKDCRYCEEAHYEEEGEKPYIKLKCRWSNYSHQPNDYCSYGRRREK